MSIANLDTPCRCSAARDPYKLAHDAACRWQPMHAFREVGVAQRTDAAVERARQERAGRP